MTAPPTLGRHRVLRAAVFLAGAGMVGSSLLTIGHFFAANYPESIWEGSFCDVGAFFNCDASAYSSLAAVAGVPIGLFGAVLGGLVVLGAVIPAAELERTNRSLLLLNAAAVLGLLVFSVLALRSLCLLCAAYYLFSFVGLVCMWRLPSEGADHGFGRRWLGPSPRILGVLAAATLLLAHGMARYHDARRAAQSGGVAARIVRQFYELPETNWPSRISPFWTAKATERFEEAPIQIVEYGDFLCPDCRFLYRQLQRLQREFAGKMNIAFQFFPLDAECNAVVAKDKHPGACELSYMAAFDPAKFRAIHDEVFENLEAARSAEWRRALAVRHGVQPAATDSATRALVRSLIDTGREYEKTSDEFAHGIRSTPTLIINKRMLIGTFPYEQLRAILRALVDEAEGGERRFLENWVE